MTRSMSTVNLDQEGLKQALKHDPLGPFTPLGGVLNVEERDIRVAQLGETRVRVAPSSAAVGPSDRWWTMEALTLRANSEPDMGVLAHLNSESKEHVAWGNKVVQGVVQSLIADLSHKLTPMVAQLLLEGRINYAVDGKRVTVGPLVGVPEKKAAALAKFRRQMKKLSDRRGAELWVHPAVLAWLFKEAIAVPCHNSDVGSVPLGKGGLLLVRAVNSLVDWEGEQGRVYRSFVWPLDKMVHLTNEESLEQRRLVWASTIGENPDNVPGPWVLPLVNGAPNFVDLKMAPGLCFQVGFAGLPVLTRVTGHTVLTLGQADAATLRELATSPYLEAPNV